MLFSIKATILASLIGLQLIAAGIIISSSFVTSEAAMLHQAERLMTGAAKNTIRHTRSFLATAEHAVRLSKGLRQESVFDSENRTGLERFFFEHLKVSPSISGLYYGDQDGHFTFVSRSSGVAGAEFRTKLISSADEGATITFRNSTFQNVASEADPNDLYDPRDRPWYEQTIAAGEITWTPPYIFYTSQEPGISVAAPVLGSDGTVEGVLGIDMEISSISNFLGQLGIGDSGAALILNNNGDVIAHPDPTKIKKLRNDGETGLRFAKIDEIDDPIAKAVVSTVTTEQGAIDFSVDQFARVSVGDEVYNAVFAPFSIGNLDWTIAIFVPQNDFLGSIVESRTQNIIIAISIACLTVLLGWLIALRVTSPLTALSQCADQIARGETPDTRSLPENFVELKHVSTAFRRMTRWLDDYRTQNSRMHGELVASAEKLEVRVKDLRAEIVERQRAEAQSQQLQGELAHVTRFSTTGEMAASLAHELNQPLTAITQYCDLILSTTKSGGYADQEVTECIEEMQDQAFRAGEIIRHLRQFIRKGETDAELVNLGQLIRQTSRLIEPQAREKNIEIVIQADEDAPMILINRVQIAQVLVNLLRNSVEAISNAGSDERVITIQETRTGDVVEISVRDTGPGITSVENAFKPFETSKPEGMGMGLSISRSIVEAHQGHLTADRNLTQGACFRITLPNRATPSVQQSAALPVQ